MAFTSLVISILALIVAGLAYAKKGGSIEEMKQKVEDISIATEGLRKKTADILEGLEKKIRGAEKKSEDQNNDKGGSQQAAA